VDAWNPPDARRAAHPSVAGAFCRRALADRGATAEVVGLGDVDLGESVIKAHPLALDQLSAD
jgi:hypothetical protein